MTRDSSIKAMQAEAFVDRGFRPNLYQYLGKTGRRFFDAWHMDPTGIPVSSTNGLKIALWRGRFNTYDEAPVITAAALPRRPVIDCDTTWYYGLAERCVVAAAENELDALVDAAQYVAANGHEAVTKLARFLRVQL